MRFGVLVDALEHRHQGRLVPVRLRPVALQAAGRDCVAAAREVTQELVVQARCLQHATQFRLRGFVVREHAQHVGIFVAEQEFDRAVLRRLEARGRPEDVAEAHVVGRRHRLQHRPLIGQLLLDRLHPREHLHARIELVALQMGDGRTQLVDHQLHPQLRGLVLDDEKHLVVVRRVRERRLRRQQGRQLQVAAITQAVAQVGGDAGFERALVRGLGHGCLRERMRNDLSCLA